MCTYSAIKAIGFASLLLVIYAVGQEVWRNPSSLCDRGSRGLASQTENREANTSFALQDRIPSA
jgi:hypothetical protein